MPSEITLNVLQGIRESAELREALEDEINSLPNDTNLSDLAAQASTIVESRVRAAAADATVVMTLSEMPDWNYLGEALLFEVATQGGVADA